MISNRTDILDRTLISSMIASRSGADVEVYDEVESTNSLMKQRARDLCEGHVIVADRQSGGRGRMGRSFYSPPGSGVYFSLFLKPEGDISNSVIVTCAAAVAACGAVREVFGGDPWIKWVNDIYIGERKVCGILAESAIPDSGIPEHIVLGVGFNVYEPDGGFPDDLKDRAGYISRVVIENGRSKLVATFINRFFELYDNTDKSEIIRFYRDYERTCGRNITVISGESRRDADAIGIDDSCRLIVRYPDGSESALFSGEISIRFDK